MIKFFKYIYLKTIAILCNLSPSILEWVRNNNVKGKAQLIKYLKIQKENLTADCNGIKFNLNLNDDIQQQLYMNIYEKTNIDYVLNLLREGDVFFDAGANVGAYTLQAAKKLKTGVNIFSFEPEPENFKRLNSNCNLNGFSDNVNRYELALTNFKGAASLYQSDTEHSGWHSLTEFKDISRNKITVKTSTLDSFMENKGIKKIDLFKIDVEANEFELLEGAEDSLRNKLFDIIYIEFNGTRLAEKNKTITDFVGIFAKYNYYPAEINLWLLDKLLKGEQSQIGVCENFLFKPGNNN